MSSSDSIETSAATIDQAIGQALAQLGAEQDDVTIEVLSTPRSGVLGLGARPARVRVTRLAPAGARSGVMSPPPAPPPPAPPQPREAPLREEPGDAPRKEQRGQEAKMSDAPPREDRREPPQIAAGGPARQERGERRPERSDTPPQPPRRERSELQGQSRSELQGQARSEVQGQDRRTAPRTSPPDGRGAGARDDRDAREGRDEPRDSGRAEGTPRPRRGRAGGPSPYAAADASPGAAGGRERGGRRPGETAPTQAAEARDHEQGRDDDRDPFASVDEAGSDPRKIADLQEQAREAAIFLERILALMGEQAKIEPAESDDPETLELNIKGDGSGILIGRHGQTLDAIEYLVNRLLARKIKDAAPISIDTESYRARRRRLLQRMALSKGEQAKREHVAVALEPMPPRDRRIVHLALKDDPMIATRSTGEGFMRAIEIVPVDERRDPTERGNENRGRGRGRERERDQDKAPLGEQGGFKHGQKRIV
jgi:spoIIIJ-associated protein